ncbi:MAG TPA: hypothetical protein VFW96_02110 [Thermomicrobiales bacterium]|nr:hypothetical protein [Thermomicrobiales bacterium]
MRSVARPAGRAAPAPAAGRQEAEARAPAGARWAARLGPPCLYLLVAIGFSWPLPSRLSSAVLGATNDVWAHLWWLWWVREALLHGHNPYVTDQLYFPYGAPLYLMGMDLVSAVLGVPLQGLVGLVTTYNLLAVAAAAFGAYAAYLLALDVTGSRAGALVAGALFGFAPLQASFANMGQLELASVGFLPLAILFLLRLRGAARPRDVALAAVCLALATLSSWYQALDLALFAAVYAGWVLAACIVAREWARAGRFVARLAAAGALAAAFLSPVLVPALREARDGGVAATPREWIASASLDLADAFRPNALHPLNGGVRPEFAAALGFAALALALLGLWAARRRAALWAAVGVVAFALALGPYLLVDGRRVGGAVLPYNLLYALPLGSIARAPVRFEALTLLAGAVLAAWGVAWLAARAAAWRPARAGALRALVAALALALVLAEWLPVPRPLQAATADAAYAALAAGPPGGVYELPYDAIAHEMYWQTLHGRPIVGGYISRKIPYPLLDAVPVVKQLRERGDPDMRALSDPDIVAQPPPLGRAADIFDAFGIRYLVVHKDLLTADQTAALLHMVGLALPPAAIIRDDVTMRIYRVPAGDPTGVVAGFGGGWYDLERRADTGTRFRWTDGDATLSLTLLDPAPRTVHLTATAFGYHQPFTVDVLLNDRVVTTVAVGLQPTVLDLTLPLDHGYNALRFRARARPVRPSDVGGGRDDRALAIALADVHIEVR